MLSSIQMTGKPSLASTACIDKQSMDWTTGIKIPRTTGHKTEGWGYHLLFMISSYDRMTNINRRYTTNKFYSFNLLKTAVTILSLADVWVFPPPISSLTVGLPGTLQFVLRKPEIIFEDRFHSI